MKKGLIIITLVLVYTSCENWLDVNNDPNNLIDAPVEYILPAAEASIAVRLGGNLFNIAGFFAQYWSQAPEASQYDDIETYNIQTTLMDYDYSELFSGALNDLEIIRKKTFEKEDWGNYFAATVLRAYAFQILVDLFDKIPYTEALKGSEILNPKWDDGKDVYEGIFNEINEAANKLTFYSNISNTDMILNGNMQQWIGFSNALKLKLLMRQRFVNDVSEQVKQLIDENNFMTVDVAFRGFENTVNKRNPWYETTKQLNTDANHVATVTLIKYLSLNGDPRIGMLVAKAENTDTYEGIYPALKQVVTNLKVADYSRPTIVPDQPVYLFTLSELYLFIAEAQLIFYNDLFAAKIAYEKAIDYSLMLHGIDPESIDLYSNNSKPYYFDITTTPEELFKKIMMQKWICLCHVNNFEAWCELRRTNIPEYYGDLDDYGDGHSYPGGKYLDLAKKFLSADQYYANRLPYPDVAISRNINTPKLDGISGLEQNIWWDNN